MNNELKNKEGIAGEGSFGVFFGYSGSPSRMQWVRKGKCAFSSDRRTRSGKACSKPGAEGGGHAFPRAPAERVHNV